MQRLKKFIAKGNTILNYKLYYLTTRNKCIMYYPYRPLKGLYRIALRKLHADGRWDIKYISKTEYTKYE